MDAHEKPWLNSDKGGGMSDAEAALGLEEEIAEGVLEAALGNYDAGQSKDRFGVEMAARKTIRNMGGDPNIQQDFAQRLSDTLEQTLAKRGKKVEEASDRLKPPPGVEIPAKPTTPPPVMPIGRMSSRRRGSAKPPSLSAQRDRQARKAANADVIPLDERE